MTKKQKEQRKKRLKSLIILLFLTIVMLSTSTYAWFTANKSVTVDPIDVYVAASNGLQISTNASSWKTVVSNNDIKNPTGYTNHKNMLSGTLVPVSTNGKADNGYLPFYLGTVEGANISGTSTLALTATRTPTDATDPTDHTEKALATNASSDFIAFDIFLRLDGNTASPVYLSDGSGVAVTVASPANEDKGLQNAARYAFVQEGYATVTAVSQDPSGIRAAVASGTTNAVVIEPNADQHTAFGVANATDPYGQTTNTGTGNAALAYKGVKAEISSPIALAQTSNANASATYFEAVPDLRTTTVAYTSGTIPRTGASAENRLLLFTLQPGVTKFRVYMWIEGQDVDCENNASGAYLTYKIGFTLNQNDAV